jgi:hypothetical protein
LAMLWNPRNQAGFHLIALSDFRGPLLHNHNARQPGGTLEFQREFHCGGKYRNNQIDAVLFDQTIDMP